MLLSKKSLIIEQAALLFAEQAIETTSIEHITKQCGISKGAFYLHFKSKDDLILQIFDYFFKDITARFTVIETSASSPKQKLHAYVVTFFVMLEEKLPFISMYIRQQRTPNEALFDLFTYYNKLIDHATKQLLVAVYGQQLEGRTLDTLVTFKGLMRGYSEHILWHRTAYDYDKLATTIVERLSLIVAQSATPFLQDDALTLAPCEEITVEVISEEITLQLKIYPPQSLIYETLSILQQELQQAKPRKAIIHGMLATIQTEHDLQWLIFLLNNGKLH